MADDLPFDPKKLPHPAFKPSIHVPTLTEAFEGWRAWKVSPEVPPFGTAPRLYSATFSGYYWAPRRTAMAECDKCSPDGDPNSPKTLPGDNCGCGFYAARSFAHLMTMSYPKYNIEEGMIAIVGQCALWGRVIEATQGWRAARAYPKKLFVPFEAADLVPSLKQAYGVPVVLKNILVPGRKEVI